MTVIPFKQPAGKNSPTSEDADIITEYGSVEKMIEAAKEHARDILCSCDDDCDPIEVAMRAIQGDALAGKPVLPAAFWAACVREIERLIEAYRY